MDPLEQKQKHIVEQVASMVGANADGLSQLLAIVRLESFMANPLNNPYDLRVCYLEEVVLTLQASMVVIDKLLKTF